MNATTKQHNVSFPAV